MKIKSFFDHQIAPLVTRICIVIFLFFLSFALPAIAEVDTTIDEFGKRLDLLYKNKEYDEMISLCNQEIEKQRFKNLVPVYYLRGYAFYEKADYDQAISDFEAAVKIKKEFGYGYYMLSSCYQKKGLTNEAVEMIKQAYMYSPKADHIEKKYKELTANTGLKSDFELLKQTVHSFMDKYPGQFKGLHYIDMAFKPYVPNLEILNSPPMKPDNKIYYTMGEVKRIDGEYYVAYIENVNRTAAFYFTFRNRIETERGKIALENLRYNEEFIIIGRLTDISSYQTVLGETKPMAVFDALHIERCTRRYMDNVLYGYVPTKSGEKI